MLWESCAYKKVREGRKQLNLRVTNNPSGAN
jgi:hypothetical protein